MICFARRTERTIQETVLFRKWDCCSTEQNQCTCILTNLITECLQHPALLTGKQLEQQAGGSDQWRSPLVSSVTVAVLLHPWCKQFGILPVCEHAGVCVLRQQSSPRSSCYGTSTTLWLRCVYCVGSQYNVLHHTCYCQPHNHKFIPLWNKFGA